MNGRSEMLAPGPSGLQLHALHWGESNDELLIALHGGGANAHWWDHLAPSWAPRFHVVALDFRGHGRSERPQTVESTGFEDDLVHLIAELGGARTVLVGHSMGAGVALAHSVRSSAVRGLVLLDPARGSGAKRASRRMRLALSLRRSYATRSEAIERLRFLPDAPYCSEALRRSIAEHSVAQEPDGRWSYCFDGRAFTLPPSRERPDPSAVRCPTLVIRGEESGILPGERAREFVSEFHEARLVEIPRAGHHVQLDAPSETQDAITAFLDELPT